MFENAEMAQTFLLSSLISLMSINDLFRNFWYKIMITVLIKTIFFFNFKNQKESYRIQVLFNVM